MINVEPANLSGVVDIIGSSLKLSRQGKNYENKLFYLMTRSVVQLCSCTTLYWKVFKPFAKGSNSAHLQTSCFQDIFENLIFAKDCQSLIVAKVGPFRNLANLV